MAWRALIPFWIHSKTKFVSIDIANYSDYSPDLFILLRFSLSATPIESVTSMPSPTPIDQIISPERTMCTHGKTSTESSDSTSNRKSLVELFRFWYE